MPQIFMCVLLAVVQSDHFIYIPQRMLAMMTVQCYYYMQVCSENHNSSKRSRLLSCQQLTVLAFSDVCDQSWRHLRDGLTITGFVSSILPNASLFISLFIQLLLWKCKDFLLTIYVKCLSYKAVTVHNPHALLEVKLDTNGSIFLCRCGRYQIVNALR